MADLNKSIDEFVAGDAFEILETITNIPSDQTLVKAWLTIKADLADDDPDALVQKVITTNNNPGTGQITDDGTGDTVGKVRFDLTPADTALLVPSWKGRAYFGIRVLTSGGHPYTPLAGRIAAIAQVTRATS